jgi:hypothetical protein
MRMSVLKRTRLAVALLTGILECTTSCSSSSPSSTGDAGRDGSSTLPPGAVAGNVGGTLPPCTGDAYLPVPAADCPFIMCNGTAYALCTASGHFGACDCEVPSGYTEIVQ